MDLTKQATSNFLTGSREIDVLNPESYEPSIKEVLNALPKINRYNGHTLRPYSVAAHSIACCYVANVHQKLKEPHLLLAILLHDAAEAYIGDIVRPIKHTFHPDLEKCEEAILLKLLAGVGIKGKQMEEVQHLAFTHYVKIIDTRMALTEIHALMPDADTTNILVDFDPYYNYVLPHLSSWESERLIMGLFIDVLQAGRVPDFGSYGSTIGGFY